MQRPVACVEPNTRIKQKVAEEGDEIEEFEVDTDDDFEHFESSGSECKLFYYLHVLRTPSILDLNILQ